MDFWAAWKPIAKVVPDEFLLCGKSCPDRLRKECCNIRSCFWAFSETKGRKHLSIYAQITREKRGFRNFQGQVRADRSRQCAALRFRVYRSAQPLHTSRGIAFFKATFFNLTYNWVLGFRNSSHCKKHKKKHRSPKHTVILIYPEECSWSGRFY